MRHEREITMYEPAQPAARKAGAQRAQRASPAGVPDVSPARAAASHGFSLGALAEPGRGEAPPIQRKVGFEVEYQVPTFRKATANVALQGGNPDTGGAQTTVKAFLFGGLPYKVEIGENENFKLTADHSGRVTREPLRAAIAGRGKLNPAETKDPDARSNLEYVTPAVDELAKGADKKLDSMIGAVVAHATDTFTQAQAATPSFLKAPAPGGFATGSAADELEAWLPAEDFNAVKPTLTEFREGIADECYLQATVGVVPSAMRKLFRTDTAEGGLLLQTDSIKHLYAAINAVGRAVELGINDMDYMQKLHTEKHPQTIMAISGLAHLLAAYLVGEAASQTSAFPGGSIKNAVPFLLKVDPKSLVEASTMELSLFERMPDEVVNRIATVIGEREEITVEYWRKLKYEARDRAVKDKVTAGTVVNLTKMFMRGEKPAQTGIQKGGSVLPNVDPMPGTDPDFQSGVPLEYRYIAERPKASALKAALLKIVTQARDLNLSQFPDNKRESILERVKE